MFRPLLVHHQGARKLYRAVAWYIVQLSVADRYNKQLQHDKLLETAVYSSDWGTRWDCATNRNVAGSMEFSSTYSTMAVWSTQLLIKMRG